ncbi:pentatricopeptide repeat-containing protein At2g30100, chloroplastic-like [Actinidia eriantha]|uniref:pentatricopeptide repeat-containing protein At2g30100, chloroplastic-like n=1 Tax=Actinidia eriantha TaxID=165200 RepID=UPI002590D0A3|nr:pentatricopeptide repeat-containing protein At2g30100, chloroplastic-like [Actinidia eriantha]
MASTHGFASLTDLGTTYTCSSKRCHLLVPQIYRNLVVHFCSRVSITICNNSQNPRFVLAKQGKIRNFRLFKSVELDRFLTSDDEDEMSEGFFEAIEELERMAREPSDVLEEMHDRLSARELRLVLVYFSQEGRDSWCALEVFEWLRKENRVDEETMELMVSLMCGWVKKLIEEKNDVANVVDLLVDMDCVGLKPNFSMMEKVISFYWEMGEKAGAVAFVREVLRRGISYQDNGEEGHKAGPTGYLAWKMMAEGKYRDAVNLVINLRESGLRPEVYSYLIAMTAVVNELNEFAKALRKLKGFSKNGLIAELDSENVQLVEQYQSDLLADGVRLSNWVTEEGESSLHVMVHDRLLSMYICAGRGLEAERQLWAMKLAGKEADGDRYDIVLAICASQKEAGPIARLMSRMEVTSSIRKKKTLSWLLRGYIKGGHFDAAAETVIKMLDYGLYPEFLDRAAVLRGLRNRIQQSGNVETYLRLCKRLSDENLAGPCLIYLHMRRHKLWIIKML